MIKQLSTLADYSKLLCVAVIFAIVIQCYYTVQFARLCTYIDHGKTVPHPIAFEAFPFVTYNMYSGKVTDWQHYNYLRIETDGVQMSLSNMPVFEAEQILNPLEKYLMYEPANFNEEPLHSLLLCQFDSSQLSTKIYDKVSNHVIGNCHDKWGRWLTWYIASVECKPVHSIKVFSCNYRYNKAGRPEIIDEKPIYQYP